MTPVSIGRREFLQTTALATGALAVAPGVLRQALAAGPVSAGAGPYGALEPADALGLRLPKGFRSRLIAQAGAPVTGAPTYQFPLFPDGAATFGTADGGWILTVNSEIPGGQGGVSAIDFAKDGAVRGAKRILGNTSTNCAGGATPWGTWLSCEEVDDGFTWECDPTGAKPAVQRPALGKFKHEAFCIDPVGRRLYGSEDIGDSAFYRFTPEAWPSLERGTLEVATDGGGGRVVWVPLPNPLGGAAQPTRNQVPGTLRFRRGEGIFHSAGVVYLVTTSDSKIHAYDTATETIAVLYDGEAPGATLPGKDIDNIWVHGPSGDIFVCEDADDLQLCVLTPDRVIAPFVQLDGPAHSTLAPAGTELTGVCFDPSGTRMYVSSQRSAGGGQLFEISGPFRRLDVGGGTGGVEILGPGGGAGAGAVSTFSGAPAARPAGVPSSGGRSGVRRALRVRLIRSIGLSTLRRRGLRVVVDPDAARALTFTLTARRGRRKVVLARATRTPRSRKPVELRLKPTAAALRRAGIPAAGTTRLEIRVAERGTGRVTTLPVRLFRRS